MVFVPGWRGEAEPRLDSGRSSGEWRQRVHGYCSRPRQKPGPERWGPTHSPSGSLTTAAGSASRLRRNCTTTSPVLAAPATAPATKPLKKRRDPRRREAKLLAAILPETLAFCLSACTRQVGRFKANRNHGVQTRMRHLESPGAEALPDARGWGASARPLVTDLEAQAHASSTSSPFGPGDA